MLLSSTYVANCKSSAGFESKQRPTVVSSTIDVYNVAALVNELVIELRSSLGQALRKHSVAANILVAEMVDVNGAVVNVSSAASAFPMTPTETEGDALHLKVDAKPLCAWLASINVPPQQKVCKQKTCLISSQNCICFFENRAVVFAIPRCRAICCRSRVNRRYLHWRSCALCSSRRRAAAADVIDVDVVNIATSSASDITSRTHHDRFPRQEKWRESRQLRCRAQQRRTRAGQRRFDCSRARNNVHTRKFFVLYERV